MDLPETLQSQAMLEKLMQTRVPNLLAQPAAGGLSRGIIDKLDDQELEAVIAHELSHIRNKDVRLMIVSIRCV